MESLYITRSLEPVVKKAVREFPSVVIIGPRQSGKTTLLKYLFKSDVQLVSLEAPDIRLAASRDPRGFLSLYPPPIIFDEIQYVPELLPYIKERIDTNRNRSGRYILTGSQNILLMEQVTESLAGRSAVLRLLPLSQREIQGDPQRPFYWERGDLPNQVKDFSMDELWQAILRGAYPELAANPQRDAYLWQSSYMQTYLERDVRNLKNIGDLSLFQTFLRALASRSAQLLNLSELARDVGISVPTAKDWLSVLEASFQVFLLRPYYVNIGKRLVKSPKVYFMDTGLLCYLVGLQDARHAASGPMGGAIFENLVIADLYKALIHRAEEPRFHFWRTASGNEVDVVLDRHDQLIPMEIKLSATPRPEMAAGISFFRKDFQMRVGAGYVIHPGSIVLPMGEGSIALPFSLL